MISYAFLSGLAHVPAPKAAGVPFFDASERPVVVDALLALEAQLNGAAMMPPMDDEALRQRLVAVSVRVGSSPAQLVNHWLYWAKSRYEQA